MTWWWAMARRGHRGIGDLADYCGEHPAQQGIMLGYGGIRLSEVNEGLRLLAECFAAERPAR